MEGEHMVKADVILKRFGIARSTFYLMVREGRIPFHDVTQPWHTKRQLRFLMSDVERILAKRTAA